MPVSAQSVAFPSQESPLLNIQFSIWHIIALMADPNTDNKHRKWTLEEDDLLRSAFHTVQGRRWGLIANIVGSRSPIQCLHRWNMQLRPGLAHGAWTKEEDAQVMAWVSLHGPKMWTKCAEQLGIRSSKQCRERWVNSLNSGIKQEKWSQEEDNTLLREYSACGPKWTIIAQMLPGRTENSVKNRFYSNIRKRKSLLSVQVADPADPHLDATALSLIEVLGKIYEFRSIVADARQTCRTLNKALDEEWEIA